MHVLTDHGISTITVPDRLPGLLRDFTKAVIRAEPEDLIQFSAEYFRALAESCAAPGLQTDKSAAAVTAATCSPSAPASPPLPAGVSDSQPPVSAAAAACEPADEDVFDAAVQKVTGESSASICTAASPPTDAWQQEAVGDTATDHRGAAAVAQHHGSDDSAAGSAAAAADSAAVTADGAADQFHSLTAQAPAVGVAAADAASPEVNEQQGIAEHASLEMPSDEAGQLLLLASPGASQGGEPEVESPPPVAADVVAAPEESLAAEQETIYPAAAGAPEGPLQQLPPPASSNGLYEATGADAASQGAYVAASDEVAALMSPADARLIALARQLFEEADADGSGGLDRKEFRNVMRSAELGLSTAEVRAIMAEADENEDGCVDWREFLPAMLPLLRGVQAKRQAQEEQDAATREAAEAALRNSMPQAELETLMRGIFTATDTDGSGALSRKEFKACLRSDTAAGLHLSRQDINTLLTEVDTDGDGLIDYEEFIPVCFEILVQRLKDQMLEEPV